MKKILRVLLFLLLYFPWLVHALELPELNSSKVLLYDKKTGEILYNIGKDEKSSIASLTKIMTTIVALENIDNLSDVVTITSDMLREVPYDASIAGLKLEDRVTYEDLLYGIMLPSGADAAIAIAHSIGGSTSDFVELMNAKASELNLDSTHFVNVTGYDAIEHYSTPSEVLKILLYALKNEEFKKVYTAREYTMSNGRKVESTILLFNKLVGADISGIVGSKTGFTSKAGTCMSALLSTNGRELILITLGAQKSNQRAYHLEDTLTVLNYLNENYKDVVLFKKGEVIKTIPVEDSKEEKYEIKVSDDIVKYAEINTDPNDLKVVFEGREKLNYKNTSPSKIGTVKYYYKDELLKEEDIILDEKIHFSTIKFLKKYSIEIVFISLVFICCVVVKAERNRRKKKKSTHLQNSRRVNR